MAIECPDCRTVTGNDNSEQCVACGRYFYAVKRRSSNNARWLTASIVTGLLLAYIVVQRRC